MLLSDGALAPVSLADSTPTLRSTTFYPTGGLSFTARHATYAQVYKSQLWVSTLVNKIAYSTARLPLKVYRKTAGGREDARDSPYGRLLAEPNPRQDPFFFWLWTVSTFEVYGEALWVKVRAAPNRPPVALYPMHPANVSTRREPDGSLTYILNSGTSTVAQLEFAERDVVHFRSYNPETTVRGMSRLEPLRQTLVNEDAARRATTGFWKNGARPAMFLTHPGELSKPAQDRLVASWDMRHGGVDNFGKTAILEEGMEPHTVSLTAEEAQYIETRRINREEACAIYDMPPPVVHILDRATFSNITEQMRSLYRDTMAPRLGLYESVMDTQLAPDFGDETIYQEFLMDEVLRGSFEARAESYSVADWMTIAEKRQLENLPFIEGTDRIMINSASVPLVEDDGAGLSPQDLAQMLQKIYLAVGTVISADEAREILNRGGANLGTTPQLQATTVRSVMGRLGRAKSLADIEPARLTAGLNGDAPGVLALFNEAKALDAGIDGFRAGLTKEQR